MAEAKTLRRRQLDRQFKAAEGIVVPRPSKGWLKTIRSALGMTMQQVAERLGVTKSLVSEFERRESEDRITLGSLRKTADALGCDLVYTLVPREGTLEETLRQRARAVALQRVERTAHTMRLEAQDAGAALDDAVDDIVADLMRQNLRALWDDEP